MSDRLISADKARQVLTHLLYETALNNDDYIMDIYEDIIENRLDTWIELIPTADAEPVRHGHWIEERNPMMYQMIPYVWVCDQCGTAFYYKSPYCRECGAKMDEEDKDAKTN